MGIQYDIAKVLVLKGGSEEKSQSVSNSLSTSCMCQCKLTSKTFIGQRQPIIMHTFVCCRLPRRPSQVLILCNTLPFSLSRVQYNLSLRDPAPRDSSSSWCRSDM